MGLNISNRLAYTFIVFGILVLSVIIIDAVAPNPGHDSSQLDLAPLYIDTVNNEVGIGTSNPLGTLHVQGGPILFIGSPMEILIGENSFLNFGIISWDSAGNFLEITASTLHNSITILDSGEVGINQSNPDSALHVGGSGHFVTVESDTSVVSNIFDGAFGRLQTLSVETITTESGLTINTTQFIMLATNGDICVVKITSGSPSTFFVTCESPTNVCGNYIVEPSIGEECDPSGVTTYNYSQTGTVWSCTTGLAADNFNRVILGCSSGPTPPACTYDSTGEVCECKTKCRDPEPPHENYWAYYNCLDFSSTFDACEANQPFV